MAYGIGDKVKTWWGGKYVTGKVIEVLPRHCYRVLLSTMEICFRLESDLETA